MNLEQVKREIRELARSPVSERMYPITSDWIPISDVLAVINRFEKHWSQHGKTNRSDDERKLLTAIFGET